jgi:hypothetical protein
VERNTKTASKIKVGDVIRKYAPYEYWLDYQTVTQAIPRLHGRVAITRADGQERVFSANARFEIRNPAE